MAIFQHSCSQTDVLAEKPDLFLFRDTCNINSYGSLSVTWNPVTDSKYANLIAMWAPGGMAIFGMIHWPATSHKEVYTYRYPLKTLMPRQNENLVISQTIFSNVFSCMKPKKKWLRFYWILFQWVELTIFLHWCRQWLGVDESTSHYLNQWWLVYGHICRPQ